MKPGTGTGTERSTPGSRKPSIDDTAQHATTFFLTRTPSRPSFNTGEATDTISIRTPHDAAIDAPRQPKYGAPRVRQPERSTSRRRSTIKPPTSEVPPGYQGSLPATPPDPSTPALAPEEGSLTPDSPKSLSSRSLQRSDGASSLEDNGSQAVASDDDDAVQAPISVEDSAPQLIMPSIKMPSRRPFTARGKELGRLKILVAGSQGSGRTSLIKSVVQLCSDIVHVDPMSASNSLLSSAEVSEIHASTKPYPAWWPEIDDSKILRRRKSVGDAVLERNVCFVDTMDARKLDHIMHYIERQFVDTIDGAKRPSHHMTGLLSGAGGSQVDVILYLITPDTLEDDRQLIKQLTRMCNVVPLISKADRLSAEQVAALKEDAVIAEIALPRLPAFGVTADDVVQATAPYTVSSANGPDFDNMDASLLMSPEYIQPLVTSELSILIDHLFQPAMASYLRHTTAKKLVSWLASNPRLTTPQSTSLASQPPSTFHSPTQVSMANPDMLGPVSSPLLLNVSNSYTLAKVADHTQREEHLAQVRLSRWASDLQFSLQRERERYERLAQTERSQWLANQVSDQSQDRHIVARGHHSSLNNLDSISKVIQPDGPHYAVPVHDPLGLLRWREAIRARGWIALQVVGSFGVIGGIALWLAKTWGITTSLQDWVSSWTARYEGWHD